MHWCIVCPVTIKVLIAIEKQKVAEKEAETSKKMAISEAEKNANVSKILMEQKLMEKDSARKQEEIDNQMYLARQRGLADADFYRYDDHFPFIGLINRMRWWKRFIVFFCPTVCYLQRTERSRGKQADAYSWISWTEVYWGHSW